MDATEQCCGNCRYWGKTQSLTLLCQCTAPLPMSACSTAKRMMHADEGTSCPVFMLALGDIYAVDAASK